MKNSSLKGVFGVLAAVGVAIAVKKMANRKRAVKGIFEEYGIKGRTPFAFDDKIRELDDEKYEELKSKIKQKFASHRCCKRVWKEERAEA